MSAWAGVRPIRFYPGMRSPLADPEGIGYILPRENSEGIYPGRERDLADLVKVMPDLADRRGRKVKDFGTEGRIAVKVVTLKGAERIVREAGGLQFEHFHVDDAARRLVRFPQTMDVVLCMNFYGDVLSDLGAETAGGLGLAPSGNFGDGWAYFESVHGSAPTSRGKASPTPREDSLGRADAGAHGHGR